MADRGADKIDARGLRHNVTGIIDSVDVVAVAAFHITIAGQTAPGQGVQLKNRASLNAPIRILASHVVIRHLHLRPGPSPTKSDNVDGLRISGVGSIASTGDITDIVLDHLSVSWGVDELLDNSPWADRITVQDSLIYEGLNKSSHPQGLHSKGPNLRGCGISIIRSLIATNVIRNPNNTCGMEVPGSPRGGGGVTGENEFRNNVVYNGLRGFFDYFNGRGDSEANVAGNVFLRGPSTLSNLQAPYAVDARDFTSKYEDSGLTNGSPGFVAAGTSDKQALCLQDNVAQGFPGNPGAPTTRPPAIHGVLDPRDAHIVKSTDCVNNPVGNPANTWTGGIRGLTGQLLPSGEVLDAVLASSGAFHWDRDSADTRMVSSVRNRSGTIIDNVAQVGGWPVLAGGAPPADGDADGMPDAWETTQGLSPSDAGDRNGDLDGDGYTNLEEYLDDAAHDQGGTPPPPPPPRRRRRRLSSKSLRLPAPSFPAAPTAAPWRGPRLLRRSSMTTTGHRRL